MENNEKLIEILLEKITDLENTNKNLGVELYKSKIENVKLQQELDSLKNN